MKSQATWMPLGSLLEITFKLMIHEIGPPIHYMRKLSHDERRDEMDCSTSCRHYYLTYSANQIPEELMTRRIEFLIIRPPRYMTNHCLSYIVRRNYILLMSEQSKLLPRWNFINGLLQWNHESWFFNYNFQRICRKYN